MCLQQFTIIHITHLRVLMPAKPYYNYLGALSTGASLAKKALDVYRAYKNLKGSSKGSMSMPGTKRRRLSVGYASTNGDRRASNFRNRKVPAGRVRSASARGRFGRGYSRAGRRVSFRGSRRSSSGKGSGIYKVPTPSYKQARRTGLTGAQQSAFAATVPDFYFTGSQFFLESTVGRKSWSFLLGSHASADILAIVTAIVTEHPHVINPQVQVRASLINMYNNMTKADAVIEEIPIYTADDNTFTTATMAAAWVTDWSRTFVSTPSPGAYEYYQWPTTHTFENKAFWQNRGVRALKSRTIRVPGGATRTSRHMGKWETFNFTQLESLDAGNTMTAFKTKWFHVSVLGTTLNTCDVFDGPTTRGFPDAAAVLVNHRQIIKYEYRWLNENSPGTSGEIRPTTYLPDPAYTALQYGPGRDLQPHVYHTAATNFPVAGDAQSLVRTVNINPVNACNGDVFVPDVDEVV